MMSMAVHIVIESNDSTFGGNTAGEGDAGSPGSGGASPYLRRHRKDQFPLHAAGFE